MLVMRLLQILILHTPHDRTPTYLYVYINIYPRPTYRCEIVYTHVQLFNYSNKSQISNVMEIGSLEHIGLAIRNIR